MHSQSTMWSLAWIWLIVLFCNVIQAAAPDWQVVNYPIYTGVWARVKINGVSIRSAGSKLAAFYGDELRGVAVIRGTTPEDDIDGEYYFNLQFGANDASEKGFHFKLWNSADDKIYDIDKTLDFDINYPQKPEIYGGIIGGGFAPCIMNVVMPYTITVINGITDKSEAFEGETVTIMSNDPPAGKLFDKWTSDDLVIQNETASITTFIMPAKNVTVIANYIDDLPVVSVAATDATATEPTTNTTASDKGAFRISRTGSTTNALTVYFSVGGTATSGTDYAAIGTSASIPAGSDHVDVTVTPKYDTASESNETVVLTLTSKTTYELGTSNAATVTIVNTPIYTITATNGTASPSVAAAGATVTVTANTPAAGKRFSTWTSNDVTFANAASSTTTFTMSAKNVTVTANYIDDLPVVSVAATDSTATEPATNTTASDKGTFRISRTGSTSNALTVYFSVGGTAASGTDYTAIGTSATIPAGSDHVDVTVTPKYDTASESNETVVLTLTSKTTYELGTPNAATVTIVNTPIYTITAANGTASPSVAATGATVTITADAPAAGKAFDKWTSNDVTFANAASSTTTFTMPAKNVTVTANYKEKDEYYTITVNGGMADKTKAQAGETVTITAVPPNTNQGLKIWSGSDGVTFVGSILGPTTTFTMPAHDVTITASFVVKSTMPAVAVRSTTNTGDNTAMEPMSATASADKGKFTFTRTNVNVAKALTVYYSIRGTAVNGTDYKPIASNVTFAANSTSVAVEIEPLFDGITEPIETVEVVLEPESGTQTYRGGTYTDATVTIEEPVPAYVTYTLSASDGSDIVAAGAQWKIDDGDWNDSGDMVTTISGTHDIVFKEVAGYVTPATQTVTLVAGEENTGSAIYTQDLPKLTVEGGKINGNSTSGKFAPGEVVTIMATLPTNQGLKVWTPSKDVEFIGSRLAATTTIEMPAYDVTVAASFIDKNKMPAVSVRSNTNTGDDAAAEPTSVTASADKGKFTFTRTMPTGMTGALTVYFDIRGTATNGVDYKNIQSSVTFASGKTSVECEIEPLFDGITEPVETVEVVLIPATPTQTYRGGTYTDATVVIESINPVMHAITVLNGKAMVNNEVVTKAAEGATVTITANAPAEGETFKNWTSGDVAIPNATYSTTTFTMPAKNVEVTANYEPIPGPVPYHPADCMTKDYFISGLEYLQYVGPVKAAALGNFEYEWDGSDVFSIVRKATRGAGSVKTRGEDDIDITRTVSSTTYTANSIVEVTLAFNGVDKMNNLFIGERIPEGWTVVGEAADYVVNGVLRATWNALEDIPASFTYAIQAPEGNLAANYVISSNSKDTGCFMDGAMVGITVADTELRNNCHPADCIDKDNIISGLEYLKYAGPVMALALANEEYTWDGVDVLSIKPKNATRGGGASADDVAITRSVDTATYEANGQITVTLTIAGEDGMVSLFIGEKIPDGWSVIGNHAGNVRNGVLRMTWDAPNIPSTVTYTLQAPAENLSAIYKIASSSADTGCFVNRVLFLDAGETILTHGSLRKPAEWPQDMALYAPTDGRNFRESDNLAVAFSWPSILNAEGYRLVVAAYDGTIIFDETIEENACTIRGLECGSYIWNVTAIGGDCIAGTTWQDFRFAVVPAVSVPIIVSATADGTIIKLAFDKAEPGYTDGEITYQVIFYSLGKQTLTNLTQTATVANGKAVIDLGVAASNGYLYIRPIMIPEGSFTELYIK